MSTFVPEKILPDTADSQLQLLQKLVSAEGRALGQNGAAVIADTTPVTGNFFCIVPNSATVFTTLTGNVAGYATVSFPAGVPIYGTFTAITLASGSVVAYKSQ